MLALLLLHKLLVLLLLVVTLHPGPIDLALHINSIVTEALVMGHDQVNIRYLLNIHVHLIVLRPALRPSHQ